MVPLTLAVDPSEIFPLAALASGSAVVVIWIIMATIDSTVKAKAREATRRELAAYVAEGSMTAADAAAIMNAGKNPRNGCTVAEFHVAPQRT